MLNMEVGQLSIHATKSRMEEWEDILDSYPESPDLKSFIKMLKTADVVLKLDLALFESEWISSTLFFKPVNLFDTVSSKMNETPWSKPIADAFKLISDIVRKYTPDHLYENIVTLCQLPYTPHIRKDALACLTEVTKLSVEGARDASRHISELDDVSTCKAPLAVLVGVICEHHPEVVADSAARIWRVYLNLLDSNKNTNTVSNSILQGLLGLFKHFGAELPVMEFRDLYERISKEYLMKGKCEEACLSILEHHSNLFKELLAKDVKLRHQLWKLRAPHVLRAVYVSVATAVGKDKLQKISETELHPRLSSSNSQIRYTALRIVRHLTAAYAISLPPVRDETNPLGLDHELRRGKVTLDAADAILWCIESNCPYSDKLLQTAVLFYNNIPASKRRHIVVYGLLNAPDDVRTTTTTLLIKESSQSDGSNMDEFLPLWKDIFDSKNGSDGLVLNKSRLVFGDVMLCLFVVLQAVVDDETEELPPSLTGLLTVAYHILTIHPIEDYTEHAASLLLSLLKQCGLRAGMTAGLVCVAGAAHRHCGGSLRDFCAMVRIDKCRDEALLCESCRLLIYAPEGDVDNDKVLTAIEILLTRTDVEPNVISQALERMETLINANVELDPIKLDYILSLVDKLRTSRDMSGKDARILHRDLVLFIGKYGNNNYINVKSDDFTMIADLKDNLTLNVMNPDDGATYKVNLQTILQQAIAYEDSDALQKLLSVVCAILSTNKDPSLQLSLTLVIRALCRAHAHTSSVDPGSIQQAVLLCDTVPCLVALMTYISEEKSPGVRKMVSDALEGLLLKAPGSDASEQLVKVAAEHAAVMMASDDPTVRSGGLNITETLLSALKDNHLLQRKELPHIITLILETEDLDSKNTFKMAYKMLLENYEIYSKESIDEVIKKLTKNLLKSYLDLNQEIDKRIYKEKVSATLEFFKEVKGFNEDTLLGHCKMIDADFDLKVYVMAEGWTVNDHVLDEVLDKVKVSKCVANVFEVEAVLKFFEVHANVLMERKQEVTLQALGNTICHLPPRYILKLTKQIESCMSAFNTEHSFVADFRNWYQRYEIKHVIDNINKDNIQTENSKVLKSLNFYLDLLKIPPNVCDDVTSKLCEIALDIYVENGEKYIETYKGYVADMLNVSLKHKSAEEIRVFLLKSLERVGMEFLKYFVEQFSSFLLRKPYILLEADMKPVCVILDDVLKNFLKKKSTDDDCIKVLEFIDTIWPIYETQASSEDKHTLLLYITRLPLQLYPTSAVMRSAAVLAAEGGSGAVGGIRVLPGGELCSPTYRTFASKLPARLSELYGVEHSSFQALLDAFAANADCALLDIVMKLADCDPTKGWWEEAMGSCMAVIARRGDFALSRVRVVDDSVELEKHEVSVMSIANTLFEYPSAGVCKRLLIPLLRYSTSSFCEKFYSSVINGLVSRLLQWVHGSERDNSHLRNLLREHAKALSLITLALEKIPLSSLKSQDSLLYSEVEQKQPSYLMKKASAICVTLRKKSCPEGASSELKNCYRQMHVENYKCLCAAVSIMRPAAKFYDLLFDAKVWEEVFDCDVTWDLPLRSQWTQQKTVHTVADISTGTSRSSTASTTRTRMFLRTLSENPLQFDLMDIDEEPTENSHELELVVNELNSQDCSDTLTALLQHVTSLTHLDWRDRIANVLTGDCHRNVKWTLAQMICNCTDDLKPHASYLGPALVHLVADTPRDVKGRKLLNNLHVDVLETILQWGELAIDKQHISSTIEYLLNSCIDKDEHAVSSTLSSLLGRLLDVYGTKVTVPWAVFESFVKVPNKMKTILRLLTAVTKHNIYISELLPTLTSLDEKLWRNNIKLPELFGYALACASEIARPLAQYRHFLDRKRQSDVGEYVRMLYYTQKAYSGVCDEFNFKKIIDLTPKVPGQLKPKCLSIISSYTARVDTAADLLEDVDVRSLLLEVPLEAMTVVESRGLKGRTGRALGAIIMPYCRHSDLKLRSQTVKVLLKSFEDLFGPNQGEPSAKRLKPNSSRLLSALDSPDTHTTQIIESVALGLTDGDSTISSMARERVAVCINKDDMKIRLAECFLMAICVPATLNKNRSLSVCASAFLDLLFRGLRAEERFREFKLRDEPLEMSDPTAISSKLLSNTRTYQGTFLSSKSRKPKKQGPTVIGINVQIPIDDILGTLFVFAKDKSDVSLTLCVEILRSLLTVGRGFDPSSCLSRQICDILSSTPSDITPMAVEAARILVENVSTVIDFELCLDKLLLATRCTDGENLVQLLYEETQMRRDANLFQLGTTCEDLPITDTYHSTPRLEDLTSAFGMLANWDRLTEQRKNQIKSGLPQIWVDEGTFKVWVEDYQVTTSKSWFALLVSSLGSSERDSLRCLRETDRWPRSRFALSVAVEAVEGRGGSGAGIRPEDCLVEWAARLMVRRAFIGQNDSESSDINTDSRSNELVWCKVANERNLPQLALNCIDKNQGYVNGNEAFSWNIEKANALRAIGLCSSDKSTLENALGIIEATPFQLENMTSSDVINMNMLKLALRIDLTSSDHGTVSDIVSSTVNHTKCGVLSKGDKRSLCRLLEMAMCFYDGMWNVRIEDKAGLNMILNSMADILGLVVDLDMPAKTNIFLDVIFNRLGDRTATKNENMALDEETATNLLMQISPIAHQLDATITSELFHPLNLLAHSSSGRYRDFRPLHDMLSLGNSGDDFRAAFRMLCDPRHALLRRVSQLKNYVDDKLGWANAFHVISENLLEVPAEHHSTEFAVIKKYKDELYQIYDYESTDAEGKLQILNKLIQEMHRKCPPRTTLRLSQLCPALAKFRSTDAADAPRGASLSRVLGLGKLGVVKFYEQVTVFCDAESRPVVFKVLLTDGTTRRYICKTGDRTSLDAAALRVVRSARELCGTKLTDYSISCVGYDTGIIEYVENTQRLRAMINTIVDLDEVDIGARAEDEELVLSSSSLEHHTNFCRQVPAHALRSAVQVNCFSTEDFINKKQMFLETLGSITLFSWLFGLGDRHLENILYCSQDGGLCCVDWSAMFQYGVRELPPARLTRNMLAVCDIQALEARLQSLVAALRNSSSLFLSVVAVSFKRLGRSSSEEQELDNKLNNIRKYVAGQATSRDITRQALLASSRRYKERIVKLLDETFVDFEEKDSYSPVEQVTCLLRQSTDPKILSVTRSGWEPWV